MDVRIVLKFAKAQPFQPFVLRMNDGRDFDVRHPEFIGVGKRVVTIYSDRNEPTLHVAPPVIASIEFKSQPESA